MMLMRLIRIKIIIGTGLKNLVEVFNRATTLHAKYKI